ncbi:protein of unknown function [endosymbiont DhMRE of Dentiscutata heterogama]|uniref:hypothetical protein n=1 Tax=endosymbiont DhMRE of Dentiscutata heterogama TaxID=1609546 RepID=UPI000629D322|nr:hypothetical protein [endosymbiont DhMRE of Dentiscutata heterogama]CFW93369.1 protein of unknown function [endosymbiont DhMRE of Dentiscutata heterogama]
MNNEQLLEELQNKLQNWIKEKGISQQNIKEIIEILDRKLGIPPSKKPIEKVTEHEELSSMIEAFRSGKFISIEFKRGSRGELNQ